MDTKKYNVEFISAETGDETNHLYINYGQVLDLTLTMDDGDDMVVHCLGRQPDLHQ